MATNAILSLDIGTSTLKMAEFQMQDQIKQREAAAAQQVQASNDARDAQRAAAEFQLKDAQHMREQQFADVRHQREQETAIRIAYINAQAKTEAAAISGIKAQPSGIVEGQEAAGAQ